MPPQMLVPAGIGDVDFGELVEPFRHELHVHCYRMLGSLQDAEDVVQETFLAAWQALDRFEGRSSMRTWLYRIATNRCLNAIRTVRRRPVTGAPLDPDLPPPSTRNEVTWLEPFPEARAVQDETISLAFVAALQLLPARQRAALLLRDVLGFDAVEVAEQLGTTVGSVESALKRARAGVRTVDPDRAHPPATGSPVERDLVARFTRAYSAGDVDALVGLLADDVRASMPPAPQVYVGRDAVTRFFLAVWSEPRTVHLEPVRANGGQPAFGCYAPIDGADGPGRVGTGLVVLTLAGERIVAITRFEPRLLTRFGLPTSLPDR